MGKVQYLCINRQTAQWLLESKALRDIVASALVSHFDEMSASAPFSIGPLRVRLSNDDTLLAIWNVDYATVSGDDAIGFIRIMDPYSLFHADVEVFPATFERMLMIINQRFLNRLFPTTFYFRRLESGGSKVAAPKRSSGELQNIGFYERVVQIGHSSVRSMLIVGPAYDWDKVAKEAVSREHELDELVKRAQLIEHAKTPFKKASDVLRTLFSPLADQTGRGMPVALPFTQRTRGDGISSEDVYRTLRWTYEEWISPDSPLADEQRHLIDSDVVTNNPLRVVGPAGSGKSLLMQLLAIKLLKESTANRIIFLTHNQAMRAAALDRFLVLGARNFMDYGKLAVRTLSDFMTELTSIPIHNTLDFDPEKAAATKDDLLLTAINSALDDVAIDLPDMKTIRSLIERDSSKRVLLELIKNDISTAIKARGLAGERDAYVTSEFALGQFHGILSQEERNFIFTVFAYYQLDLAKYDVLDNDDIALTMLGRLRSPLWQNLQRRSLGFDFVFVDEAQLFNDNECQIFSLLTTGARNFTPVVLALDAAQDLYAASKSGLGSLGIKGIQRGVLSSTHRMPPAVARLAYFVISKTTELFSEDFPDFTSGFDAPGEQAIEAISLLKEERPRLARSANKLIRECRSRGFRQFAIVCHAQNEYDRIGRELRDLMKDLDFMVVESRGQRPKSDHAFIIYCRPELVGGQEFDCVICIGLEENILPIKVPDNPILEQTLEQEAFREMYLCFSRARHELFILNAADSLPSPVLTEAIELGFLSESQAKG
ncbi:MAG: UvrD-helicase domain-containing protein [bacterium]|nr:UvrD-helicase domain-containing protein [bacterium]